MSYNYYVYMYVYHVYAQDLIKHKEVHILVLFMARKLCKVKIEATFQLAFY